MIIKYSRKLQRKNLILGIVFLILGLISVWIGPLNPVRYFPLLYTFFLLPYHYFLKKTPYLRIDADVLTTWNNFRKKQINLSKVIRVKKFAGDVTLFTPETKLKIPTEIIDEASMKDLDQLIASLDVEVQEFPCKRISLNHS